MNKNRLKRLIEATNKLNLSFPELDPSDLESIRDEEQEYLDNIPESLQDGDKAQRAQEFIEAMEAALEAIDTLNEAKDDLIEALDNLTGI